MSKEINSIEYPPEQYPFRIKGWDKFQHFRDRKPIWIKLYRDLLDRPDWHDLEPELAKALVNLWLLSSETHGYLPDIKTISFRLRCDIKTTERQISQLSQWVECSDIRMISDGYQVDALETETETETEKNTASPEIDEVQEKRPSIEGSKEGEGKVKTYAFESGIIKLNQKDFDRWSAAYGFLDLRGELVGLTKWAGEQGGNWFWAVSGALTKRNREVKIRIESESKKPGYVWASGIEGVT